jgi:hypothetical protein
MLFEIMLLVAMTPARPFVLPGSLACFEFAVPPSVSLYVFFPRETAFTLGAEMGSASALRVICFLMPLDAALGHQNFATVWILASKWPV